MIAKVCLEPQREPLSPAGNDEQIMTIVRLRVAGHRPPCKGPDQDLLFFNRGNLLDDTIVHSKGGYDASNSACSPNIDFDDFHAIKP
jgi:hypothetical protein